MTAALDPEGYTTSHTFDANSNLTQLVLPIDTSPLTNQTISYTYDSKGNVLTQTTQLTATENVVTAMSYNSTNDLLTRSEADNSSALKLVTKYSYDGSGHLTSVNVNCTTSGTTPPSTASTCTGAGTQDSSTNLITSYTYTANNQVETETDPRGIVTKHVYDTHGNETSTIANFVSGQSSTHERNVTTTFAYDTGTAAGKAGLVTSTTDPVGNTVSYTYDGLGRQTSEALPGDSSIPALTRTTTYDQLGNVLTETDSWTGVTRTTTHVYDKANRETSVTDPAGVESTTTYDAAGNATSSTSGGVTTTRTFDGMGNVESEGVGTDQTEHEYDGQGRRLLSEDPEGVLIARVLDRAGRLTQEVIDPTGDALAINYAYDLLGRETSATGPDSVGRSSTYDRAGRVLSTTEADATSSHSYDRNGNETMSVSPDGAITMIDYDPLNRPTVVIANYDDGIAGPDTEDAITTSYYDAAGFNEAFTDASGTSVRSIYNPRGLIKQSISNCTDSGVTATADPPNCAGGGTHNATTNVINATWYDGLGAITVAVVAQGTADEATIEYAHDAAGRQHAVKDPRGTVTRTIYDNDGRLTDTIVNCTEDTTSPAPPTGSWWNCDGSSLEDGTWNVTTSRTYDSHGNLASQTAPNGRVTTYVYDDADRVVQRIDNDVVGTPASDEDLSTYFAYDDAGRQSAVRAPTINRTTFSVTRYLYNNDGQLEAEIRNCTESGTSSPGDPAWKTCSGSGTKDADTNLVTEYGYDDRGNRVSVTAPDPSASTGGSTATVITRYAFDDENRLCGVLENASVGLASPDPCVSPGSGSDTQNVWTSYTYDGLGNLSSMTDGEGNATTYTFDASGRMTGVTDALGNTTTYGYDDLGRRISQTERGTGSPPVLVEWEYDAAGRVAERAAGGQTATYEYDDNGNLERVELGSSEITVTYDRLNRPLTVTVAGDSGATTSYDYDLDAPTWTDPSGSYAATLDAFDRQVSLTDPQHGSSAWTWSYRSDGQLASADAPNGNTTAFAYDDAGMAAGKSTTNTAGLEVSYDWSRNRAGNILSETGAVLVSSTPTSDPINAVTDYAYDPLGRLAEFTRNGSTTSFDWQAVPNREAVQVDSDPATTFTFDDANRETTSSLGNIDYDSEGRLTARPGQTLEWNDLGQLTVVKDASTLTAIATYTYDALDRLLTVTHAGGVVRFRYVGMTTQVAQVVNHSSGSVIRSVANGWDGQRLFEWSGSSEAFYGTNGHHDVTWTADASGDVSATLLYDPWGNLVDSAGTTLPDFRFQGSWFDADVELSWVVTRWYAPQLARFISEDSLMGQPADPPSRHLYAYGSAEPVARFDPDGRLWYPMKKGDSTRSLALQLMGRESRWPIIWNQNRNRLRTAGASDRARCIYINETFLTKVWKMEVRQSGSEWCTPSDRFITGNDARRRDNTDYGRVAASAYGFDWLMLTRERLVTLTEQKSSFKDNPTQQDLDRYKGNVSGPLWPLVTPGSPNAVALGTLGAGGGNVHRYKWWWLVVGNSMNPAHGKGDDAAWTMGQFVFVNVRFPTWDLLAHEYIHVLQWQGMGMAYSAWYGAEVHRLGGLDNPKATGPANRAEAIAYLWQAWMKNYSRFGESAPWREFQAVPLS